MGHPERHEGDAHQPTMASKCVLTDESPRRVDLWLETVQQDDQHGDEEGRVMGHAGR